MLDPIQQRILGVLVEKEASVPDSYPLTENALLAGCNQKSNRDPEMDLDATALHPALLALREDGFIARVEGGGRTVRYRHRMLDRLNVSREEAIVLTELLLRGPQAPGALKPRIARMGLHLEPAAIADLLDGLAAHQPKPLVERLERQPRERDHRYGHLLGERPAAEPPGIPAVAPAITAEPAVRPATEPGSAELERRIARLEAQVAELQREIAALRGAEEGGEAEG